MQGKSEPVTSLSLARRARMLAHILKVLGYSKFVSLESFRRPNFKLLADVLYWLCLTLDPATDISPNINGEADRVQFVKAAVSLLVFHTRVNVNPVQLYYADHRAVEELLKILEVFHQGYKVGSSADEVVSDFNLPAKFDKRQIKDLAKGITESGLRIYEWLDRETELKTKREQSLAVLEGVLKEYNDSNVDVDGHVKKLIGEQLKANSELEEYYRSLELKEKETLDRLKKKRVELERNEKKLKSLSKTKPAYVEELERHEKELERLYQVYLDKTRNLHFLEDAFERMSAREQEQQGQIKKYLEKMQLNIRNKEEKIFDHNIERMMGEREGDRRPRPPRVIEEREEEEDYVY